MRIIFLTLIIAGLSACSNGNERGTREQPTAEDGRFIAACLGEGFTESQCKFFRYGYKREPSPRIMPW